MKRMVHISPNFWESLDDVSKAMKEITQTPITRLEVSPLVSMVLLNMQGFVEKTDGAMIGTFHDIPVYRNNEATDDYIEYN